MFVLGVGRTSLNLPLRAESSRLGLGGGRVGASSWAPWNLDSLGWGRAREGESHPRPRSRGSLFQWEIPESSGLPWVIGSSINSLGVGGASTGGGAAESGAEPCEVLLVGGGLGRGGSLRLPKTVRILRGAPLGPWKNWFPPANLFPEPEVAMVTPSHLQLQLFQ